MKKINCHNCRKSSFAFSISAKSIKIICLCCGHYNYDHGTTRSFVKPVIRLFAPYSTPTCNFTGGFRYSYAPGIMADEDMIRGVLKKNHIFNHIYQLNDFLYND